MSYICPRCKQSTTTTISRTITRFCSRCYGEMNDEDAKLGRLIRKLAEQGVDASLCLIYSPFKRQWSPTLDANRYGWFDTPEAALLAAGISDE